MIEYGDYLVFNYGDTKSLIIGKYMTSYYSDDYLLWHFVIPIKYNTEYWNDEIHPKGMIEYFSNADLEFALHFKTFEEMIAYII